MDVDHRNGGFPNIALMKISAWHKSQGDIVEWADTFSHYDIIYKSKIFSFSEDDRLVYDTDKMITGGSGYAIKLKAGKEEYDKCMDTDLPYDIEHIYPDYSIYGITDTAYGFITRGCPRGCGFCHVKAKEGTISRKVADLTEFWGGAKKYSPMRSEHPRLQGLERTA